MNGSTNRLLTNRYNACMARMGGPLSTLVGSYCVYDWKTLPGWETGKTKEELIEEVKEALIEAENDGVEFYKSNVSIEGTKINRTFVKCAAKDIPVMVSDLDKLYVGVDMTSLSEVELTVNALHVETLGIKLPNKLLTSKLSFYSIPLVTVTNGTLRLNIHVIKCIGKVNYGIQVILDELPTTELVVSD